MHVISTLKRPVPLEHYIYTGSDTTYKIVDDKRIFNKVEYQKAVDSLKKGGKGNDSHQQRRWEGNENWTKPVRFLQKHDLLPTVVFVFSKRNVENFAYSISGVDLTNSVAEKNEIHQFIDSSLCRLKECDRELPQILRIRELLKRGIGIHHGGLLPIVKEIVEMLFARGLIKVLFATETFAMGVNMPARSVMFSKVRKHDGTCLRDLLPGEYTQMSGRAGRRGKDSAGTVLLNCMHGVPESADLFQLILGTPTKLESKFRLTYNMILNLLRIEDLKVEDMMKRSFAESSFQKTIPRQQQLLVRAEAKLARLKDPECLHEGEFPVCPIEDYASAISACEFLDKRIRGHVLSSKQIQQYLQLGRIVVLQHPRLYPTKTYGAIIAADMTEDHGLEFKLVVIDPKTRECSIQKNVRSSCIQGISKQTIPIDTLIEYGGPLGAKSMGVATRQLSQYLDGKNLKMLSPENDLKITDIDFIDLVMQRKEAEELLPTSPCHTCPRRLEHLTQALKKDKLRRKVDKLRFSLSDQNLQQMPDFQQRLEVLKMLGYVSPDLTVELKGRVAREISTCNEVVLTEMIFKNVFTALNPPEFVSILSTFICQEKNSSLVTESFSPRLIELWNYALAEVKNVAEVQNECNMVTDPEVMVAETICPAIMNVVYQWACQVVNKIMLFLILIICVIFKAIQRFVHSHRCPRRINCQVHRSSRGNL